MKTLGVLLGTAGLAAGAFVALVPLANTGSAEPALPGQREPETSAADLEACGAGTVISANYLRVFGGSPVVGSIQLKRDNCSRYWGIVTMYDKVPSGAFATAYITRYNSGSSSGTLSCDSSGGNGRVVAGQTNCRTPKIKSTSSNVTFIASGHEYQDGGSGWTLTAWGQTNRLR